MITDNLCETCVSSVRTFVRNRYFYGKLLDVLHFEREQNYFNAKRWLLNRLVTGYGIVCGLDVQAGNDGKSIRVLPGVAIDKWGREIIVPTTSACVSLPPAPSNPQPNDCDDGNCVHVSICYHECLSDPVPALGSDCDQNALCSPGAIHERYEISIRPGKVPDVSTDCSVPDLISGTRINYPALAHYVSSPCPDCPEDSCIVLANVHLPPAGGTLQPGQIDIAVRPIVYTNDLLRDLLVCLTNKSTCQDDHPRGGKS